MSSLKPFQVFSENKILAALPREEFERIVSRGEMVRLITGKILGQPEVRLRDVFFPRSGMISLVSLLETGSAVEVGMVGDEGVVGIPALLRADTTPYQLVVQLPGSALKVKASVLREEFDRGGRFQDLILRYIYTLLTQIAQSAACNRFHTLEERLCRWLLVCRVRAENFNLTQEFLAQMLGAPRSRVSVVAGTLQNAGLIAYCRGKIRITDRRGLEASACECYGVVNEQIEHFIAA